MAVLHPTLPIKQDSPHCRKQASKEVPFLRAVKVYSRRYVITTHTFATGNSNNNTTAKIL
jgi:hypothetical protein